MCTFKIVLFTVSVRCFAFFFGGGGHAPRREHIIIQRQRTEGGEGGGGGGEGGLAVWRDFVPDEDMSWQRRRCMTT